MQKHIFGRHWCLQQQWACLSSGWKVCREVLGRGGKWKMPLDQPQSSVGICSFALGGAGKCLSPGEGGAQPQLLIRSGDRIWGHLKRHSWARSRGQKGPGALSHFFPQKWGNHRIIWAGKNLKSIEFQAHLALYCPREKEIKIGGYSPWESHLFWGSEQFI